MQTHGLWNFILAAIPISVISSPKKNMQAYQLMFWERDSPQIVYKNLQM